MLSGSLDQLIALNQIDEATKMSVLGVYSGAQNVALDKAEGDADMPLPSTFGAGLAYKGIDNLLVTADIAFTQWSSWDVIEVKLKDGSTQEILTEWEDCLRAGLGLEYKVSDPLALRFGYYTEPSAIPNSTMDISIPDPGRRHSLNFGASYDLGLFDLFASYERILVSDNTVDDWELAKTMDSFENLAGDFGVTVNIFMMGLGLNW
jgi:long-chain fatty acid transport protein